MAAVIDISLVAGRLNVRLTWNRKTELATPSTPVNAGYPMRVSAPLGFSRRTVRTEHEGER